MTESADGYFNEFWEKIIATNHQQLLIKLIKNGNIFFVHATANIDLRSVELLLKPLQRFSYIYRYALSLQLLHIFTLSLT